jgi:hypothetical protein
MAIVLKQVYHPALECLQVIMITTTRIIAFTIDHVMIPLVRQSFLNTP